MRSRTCSTTTARNSTKTATPPTWWTEADYAAFQQKCAQVARWYDGQEACPGVACSGVLTISENVADLGAVRCVLAAAKELPNPNLDKLFRAIANTWASTTSPADARVSGP